MQIEQLLQERIVILDGAMGTMIQQRQAGRGRVQRRAVPGLADKDLQGPQRSAQPHSARDHRGDPSPVSRSRRRYHRDEHVQFPGDFARGLPDAAVWRYELSKAGAECARRAVRTGPGRPAGTPVFRGGRHRSNDQNLFDLDGREQSRPPVERTTTNWSQPTPTRYGACSTAASTCCWWKPFSTR